MLGSHWRHLDKLPIDEFDAVVGGKNPRFAHSCEIIHREAAALRFVDQYRLR